jgi:hypothetical protein
LVSTSVSGCGADAALGGALLEATPSGPIDHARKALKMTSVPNVMGRFSIARTARSRKHCT